MSKRKNVFRDEYEREFNGVNRSLKGECFAHCDVCNCDIINLEAIGKAAISAHNATQKHKKSARMVSSNQTMKNFFTSRSDPTTTDLKAAAAERTCASMLSNSNRHSSQTIAHHNCSKQSSLIPTLQRSSFPPE